MRSTNLGKYVADYGVEATAKVWGISRQAVHKALNMQRDISIVELDGFVEVRESKILSRKRIK